MKDQRIKSQRQLQEIKTRQIKSEIKSLQIKLQGLKSQQIYRKLSYISSHIR
jgi:hypothetical protein